MSLKTLEYNTNDQNVFAHNSDELQIDIDGATMILVDDPLVDVQDYEDDEGFVYDDEFLEFVAGVLSQIRKLPSALSWATFKNTINYSAWSGPTKVGVAYGGASIVGEKLDLTGNAIKYVDLDANENTNGKNKGAFKFILITNYNGVPASNQVVFCSSKNPGDSDNEIVGFHDSVTGQFQIFFRDQSSAITVSLISAAQWLPVLGEENEMELNYDDTLVAGTVGAYRLFAKGVLIAVETGPIMGRSADINLLRIGSSITGAVSANFSVKKFVSFADPQHTTNDDYVPGYELEEARYVGGSVNLPQIGYDGAGEIQSIESVVHDGANPPPSNVTADIDSIDVELNFEDGNVQQSIDTTTVSYNGQILPQRTKIIPSETSLFDGFFAIIDEIEPPGDGELNYQLQIEHILYYINNEVLTVATDDSMATSKADWITYKAIVDAFVANGARGVPVPVFYSGANRDQNMILLSTTFSYNFFAVSENCLKCTLYGFVKDGCKDVVSGTARIYVKEPFITQGNTTAFDDTEPIRAIDGFFELPVVIPNLPVVEGRANDLYLLDLRWIDINGKSWKKIGVKVLIPNASSIRYGEDIIVNG